LQNLDVSWTSQLTCKGFRRLESLHNLRRLNLTNCPQLTDKAIAHLAPHMVNLEALSLAHCVRLTDLTIDTIVKSMKQLKYLVLFHIPLLTDDGAHRLAGLVDLELLDLSGCHGVSYPCVQYIQQLIPRCHINCVHLFTQKSQIKSPKSSGSGVGCCIS
jgi:hypothetical protein